MAKKRTMKKQDPERKIFTLNRLNDPARVITDIEYIDREITPPLLDGKLGSVKK